MIQSNIKVSHARGPEAQLPPESVMTSQGSFMLHFLWRNMHSTCPWSQGAASAADPVGQVRGLGAEVTAGAIVLQFTVDKDGGAGCQSLGKSQLLARMEAGQLFYLQRIPVGSGPRHVQCYFLATEIDFLGWEEFY